MSYYIDLEIKHKSAICYLTGIREKDLEKEAAAMIWQEINEHNSIPRIKKILVISKLKGPLPKQSIFIFIRQQFGEEAKDLKVAIVNLDKKSRSDVDFIETVALNNNLNFKVFTKTKEGKKWLEI